jgi:hypothetical protein
VLVYLADTGLLRDAAVHPWLAGVRVQDQHADYDPQVALAGNPPAIPPYAGHGTFVAGVLRCMAPAADVIVTNAFAVAGSELESDLVARLDAAFGLGVDIFHLSVSCTSRHDLPLMVFQQWLRRLDEYKGAVCVAAAGNSGSRGPAGRPRSPASSRSARWTRTGAAGPPSVTTAAGSTCTPLAVTWSTRTRPAGIPATRLRTRVRTGPSTAWPAGAAPRFPRRSYPG